MPHTRSYAIVVQEGATETVTQHAAIDNISNLILQVIEATETLLLCKEDATIVSVYVKSMQEYATFLTQKKRV